MLQILARGSSLWCEVNLLMPILICWSYNRNYGHMYRALPFAKYRSNLTLTVVLGGQQNGCDTKVQSVRRWEIRSHTNTIWLQVRCSRHCSTPFLKPVTYGTAGQGRQQGQLTTWVTQDPGGLWAEDRGGLGGGEERLGLQLGELLLHRAWQWGWGWDIRRQGTAQGAELKAIASLHTRVSPSLKSVLWGPHLPHPSSSHLNENVTTSWGMRPLSCPGETLQVPSAQSSLF